MINLKILLLFLFFTKTNASYKNLEDLFNRCLVNEENIPEYIKHNPQVLDYIDKIMDPLKTQFFSQREKNQTLPQKLLHRIKMATFYAACDYKKKNRHITIDHLYDTNSYFAMSYFCKYPAYFMVSLLIGTSFAPILEPILSPIFTKWSKKYIFKNNIQPKKTRIKWNQIIGFDQIKIRLKNIAINIQKQKKTKKLEKNDSILFYGPPGNGKTFVAKAFANYLNIPYFYLSAEILFETKESIKLTFEKLSLYAQKNKTPIIVFIDEIDLIIPSRKQKNISAEEKEQLQNFLSILDGVENMEGIIIIANTNHKDKLDESLIREGRIGTHIEFQNPNPKDIKRLLIHFSKLFEIIIPDDFDYDYFIEKHLNCSIATIEESIKNIKKKLKANKNKILTNAILKNH
jgi:AAA+ superfamily predicted ATPase